MYVKTYVANTNLCSFTSMFKDSSVFQIDLNHAEDKYKKNKRRYIIKMCIDSTFRDKLTVDKWNQIIQNLIRINSYYNSNTRYCVAAQEAIKLAYRMSVVLLRCPLVLEIMHGLAPQGLPPPVKSPYNLCGVGANEKMCSCNITNSNSRTRFFLYLYSYF